MIQLLREIFSMKVSYRSQRFQRRCFPWTRWDVLRVMSLDDQQSLPMDTGIRICAADLFRGRQVEAGDLGTKHGRKLLDGLCVIAPVILVLQIHLQQFLRTVLQNTRAHVQTGGQYTVTTMTHATHMMVKPKRSLVTQCTWLWSPPASSQTPRARVSQKDQTRASQKPDCPIPFDPPLLWTHCGDRPTRDPGQITARS